MARPDPHNPCLIMAAFPSLTPSEAPITPGAWPATAHLSLNGAESRIRHGSAEIGRTWRPSFVNITEADFLAILAHYRGQRSGFDPLGFSTTTLAADLTPAGFAWLYLSSPQVVDHHPDCFTVQCEFRCEPRGLVVLPGRAWRTGATTFTAGSRSGGAVFGRSAAWATAATTFTQGSADGDAPAQLAAWWDASDASTLTLNSGNVEEWRDKSGNGWHVSQSDAALRPALAAAAINGRNTVQWPSSGNAKALYNASTSTFRCAEFYAVIKYPSTTTALANYPGLFNAKNNSADPWVTLHYVGLNEFYSVSFSVMYLNGGSANRIASPFPEIGSICLIRAIAGGSGVVTTTSGISVGMDRDYSSLNRGWHGDLGEIRAYQNTLTNTEVSDLVSELRTKWAFP